MNSNILEAHGTIEHKAILDSIAHWNRMIYFVVKQIILLGDIEIRSGELLMHILFNIGETYTSNYCPLCDLFHSYKDGTCSTSCPYRRNFGSCTSSNSLNSFHLVHKGRTLSNWLKAARAVRSQLEMLLPTSEVICVGNVGNKANNKKLLISEICDILEETKVILRRNYLEGEPDIYDTIFWCEEKIKQTIERYWINRFPPSGGGNINKEVTNG